MNFFAGLELDRASPRRLDDDWLAARLGDPATRIVPVWRLRNVVTCGARSSPFLLSPGELDGDELDAAVLLGTLGGAAYFALDMRGDEAQLRAKLPACAELCELPDAGGWLGAADGALLAYARALVYWRRRHRFCGDCGNPTVSREGGHMLECSAPECAHKHFPRTDPAIIVLVATGPAQGARQRCLLGRSFGWPPRTYSTLAGFVEPGESLEAAVVREVREEAGVAVGEVRYHSSQPWPFPSSLMLGFAARAESDAIRLDNQELEDARWFDRRAMVQAIRSGELVVPRRVSIAYRLIEDWFDAGEQGRLADHVGA